VVAAGNIRDDGKGNTEPVGRLTLARHEEWASRGLDFERPAGFLKLAVDAALVLLSFLV
jgi:hypothetical protein